MTHLYSYSSYLRFLLYTIGWLKDIDLEHVVEVFRLYFETEKILSG
jgi:hypothetical protein